MLLLVFADGQKLHSPCPPVVPVPHRRAPQHRAQLKQVGRLFGPRQRARTGQRGIRRSWFIGRRLALYLCIQVRALASPKMYFKRVGLGRALRRRLHNTERMKEEWCTVLSVMACARAELFCLSACCFSFFASGP